MPRSSLTRRSFLVDGARLTALAPLAHVADAAAPRTSERVLLVVQLTGGNDGLNTVVPHRQDTYFRLRPLLGLEPRALHRLDDDHGLHPSLAQLGAWCAEGQLAVLHGVGTPEPDRSHFRALETWHTAGLVRHGAGQAGRAAGGGLGWLGHLADQLARRAPGTMPALAVGRGELPLSMRGAEVLPPTLRDDRGFTLPEASRRLAREREALLAATPGASASLAYLRDAARSAYSAAERMSRLTATPPPVAYPDTPLARDLRLVARLIAGGFGARLLHVALDGFDTHARQAPAHAALLAELDGALGAFQRDLAATGAAARVVTFVFSEFGRRAAENGSRGTDHGHGAPALVLGPGVRAGGHGTPPDLAALVDGDVPATVDFRGVLARLAREWLGLEPLCAADVPAPRFLA